MTAFTFYTFILPYKFQKLFSPYSITLECQASYPPNTIKVCGKKFNFVVGNNTFLKAPLWYSETHVRVHQTELSVLIWSLLPLAAGLMRGGIFVKVVGLLSENN